MAHLVSNADQLEAAGAAKANLSSATKTWVYSGQFTTGAAVASYVNLNPAQAAGETMVAGNTGGAFDLWIYI